MGSKSGIKFWGTRGLVSSPSKEAAKFGGNTSCMELTGAGGIVIIDTGFGASNLGEQLMAKALSEKSDLEVHIIYTHFHWDHTQGLPFFHPIYLPNTAIKIYSPLTPEVVKNNLDILFDGSYSPFAGIDSMPSQIEFIQISPLDKICNISVDFAPVDHGRDLSNQIILPTYAYRFDFDSGESIAIVADHEARDSACNDNIIEFANGVDILVHDGQYTDVEYKHHIGWGHSSISDCMKNIKASGCHMGIVTHHAPERTDKDIVELQKNIKSDSKYKDVNLEFAEENKAYFTTSQKRKGQKAS